MKDEHCFNPDVLVRLRAAYHEQYGRDPEVSSKTPGWRQIIRSIPRPKAPASWAKKPTEWLSSDEIDDVMRGYEKTFKNFKFLGSISIDFDAENKMHQCIVSELCGLCIGALIKRGKTRIGIVFNTAKHNEPGEHWVAVFCNLGDDEPYIVYFDSYAQKPEHEIRKLMLHWSKQYKAISGHNLDAFYNALSHQRKTSECGMYCLYFLHCSLLGISMDRRVPDDVVNYFRTKFFH